VKRPKASPLTEHNHGCGNPAKHPGTAPRSRTSRNPVEEDELLILGRFGPRLVNALGKKGAKK